MISTWHYVITGFLQHRGTRSRFVNLWSDLRGAYLDGLTQIELKPWNSSWDSEAEFCFRLGGEPMRVAIYAYSWGAGWGAIQFAKRLRDRGIRVDQMVLVDPVYRHRYLLGTWRTALTWIKIKIPDNVGEVHWFRQRETFPWGHDLVAANPKGTLIHEPVVLTASHVNMDDQLQVIAKCKEVAAVMSGNT